jgi:hypothetical protein
MLFSLTHTYTLAHAQNTQAPSLTEGGMLWFHDLTVPDPYYGLPVICCLVTLAMVEYGISMTGEQVWRG